MSLSPGWRTRRLHAAVADSLRRRGPRFLGAFLALALAVASFAFASLQLYGADALAVTPTLTTNALAGTEVGFQIFDNANLNGGATPTGTIRFELYGPNDPTCSSVTFPSTVTVSGNGSYRSDPFTTSQAGPYQWRAFYSGDANNDPVSTACNDPAEQTLVAKADTVLTTTASGPVALGGAQIFDTAHLSGGLAPTGTIHFELFGPSEPQCAGNPVFVDEVPVNGNGDYESGRYTPTQAGLYRWRARYSGDANNLAVTITACFDLAESVLVTGGLLTPTLTTTASGPVDVGGQVHDTATLAGGLNPTGSIRFDLYGPDNATCTGPAAGTSTVTVNGAGVYESADVTVNQPGTYRFVATYSGDLANNPVATACNDPAEDVVVSAGPGTTTTSTTAPPPTTTAPTTSTTAPPATTTTAPTTSTTAPPATTTTAPTTSTTAPTGSTTSTLPTGSTTSTLPTGSTTSTLPTGSTTSTLPTGSTTSTSAPFSTSSTSVTGGSTTTTSTIAPPSTTTTVAQVPTGTTTPPRPAPTVGVTPQTVAAGDEVTVFGNGFPARAPLDILLFSTPVLIGTAATDASGSFRTTVRVPLDTAPGPHRIVVVERGGTARAETALTVTARAAAAVAAVDAPLQAVPPAPVVAPRSTLSRTGSGLVPPTLAVGLLVVGLLMVGGVNVAEMRRWLLRAGDWFQHPPTG